MLDARYVCNTCNHKRYAREECNVLNGNARY